MKIKLKITRKQIEKLANFLISKQPELEIEAILTKMTRYEKIRR